MGGNYALQLACTVDGLRAASVFYSMNPRPLEAVSRACPIVGNYPERDFSYRSTPPQVSERQHEPNIPQELWDRCQALRASRRLVPKTGQKAARVHLLQGLAVCANCKRLLRIQTPKNFPTYW
jgi:dienelactone hydrolase